MARFLYSNFFFSGRRIRSVFLAVFWMLGLFFGFRMFLRADAAFLSLMCRVRCHRVSIIGMAGVLFLPFLLSAFAVSLRQHWLLPVIAFVRAACLAFIALGIVNVYPGGWLAVLLLQFGSLVGDVILWVFWLRPGSSNGIYFLALAAIGCVDCFFLSPFLVGL